MAQEINLNHLTANEYGKMKANLAGSDWEHFKELVTKLFQIKDLYFFESELLRDYKVKSMDELLSSYPDKFFPAGNKNIHFKDIDFRITDSKKAFDNLDPKLKERIEKEGWKKEDFEKAWYDVWLERFEVTPADPFYDEFFVYQLRNLDLLDTDEFLNYQLNEYFDNDPAKFKRFILLSLRKHGDKLMTKDQVKTVEEWVAMVEQTPSLSEMPVNKEQPIANEEKKSDSNEEKFRRSKVSRDRGDDITCLNLIQTAYFVNLLREVKVIIKDNKNLPDTWAAEAFNLLTGYKSDPLRLRMNLKGQNDVNYTDRKAVRDVLQKLINIVEKEINEQKGNKS